MSDEEKTSVLDERSRTLGTLEERIRTPFSQAGARPVVRRSLEAGTLVKGRYRIDRVLGEGGMGRIWLAEDLQELRPVALKEMQVPEGLSPAKVEELVLMFRHEFYAMTKLQHPGTLQVFDWGMTASGNRFITMEVVGGKDLSTLAREHPLDTRTIYRILIQMTQVLAFIHARLYVHCDIKASNVRITETGDVKLMDFGVMHQLGTPSPGKLKGTLEYMAPEWQRGSSIDGRADLYSLGVMAYFLATRRLPFKRKNQAALLADHLTRPPPKPSTLCPVEPALEAIILMLLSKDPRDRFQDAVVLLDALCHASGQPLPEEPLAARASYLHVPEVVGRELEMERLMNSLAEAEWGQSRAMLIGAPTGVGKSRLLQEFELQAKLAEMAYGLGQCRAEGLAPLAPVGQALRCLFPLTPTELGERLGPVLGRLVPALACGTRPVFKDEDAEKIAVFGALTEWLQTLAMRHTFVLCFEDLQWADAATVEVLNVIIRALHRSRGLVVGSFRPDLLNRLSLVFQTVDEGLSTCMELAPLTARDMETLVQQALPGLEVPPDFVTRLHTTTAGNAFFATECLRALVEEEALRRVGGRWRAEADLSTCPLPATIEEAVLARLDTVPPDRVALLRRLTPAGRSLDLPMVRALAGMIEVDLFQALDDIIARQFLQLSEGRYVFTHDAVHQALYDSTSEEARRAFHGRVAEVLRSLGGDSPAAQRAVGYHFSRSTQPRRAIEPLLRAGHASIEAKALQDATQLLKEAACLLEQEPPSAERNAQLVQTWATLAEVSHTSEPLTTLTYTEKLFGHWEATVDLAAGRAEALDQLDAARTAPEGDRAGRLNHVFRSISLEAPLRPVDVFWKKAELQILQAISLAVMGRTEELQALVERLGAEQPVDSPYRAGVLIARAGLSLQTGHFAGVLRAQREQVERLRAFRGAVGGHPSRWLAWALGMGCYFLNMVRALRGEPLDAEATRDGFEVAEAYGFSDIRMNHLFTQLVRASFTGDAVALAPVNAEKTELIRKLGNPRLPERNLAIYLPPFYLERGEHEMVEAALARGQMVARGLPDDRVLQRTLQVYAACRDVLFGDVRTARESLAKALVSVREGHCRMETLLRVYQSRFERAQGREGAAREAAEAALARALAPLTENPFDEILARRALAPLVPVEEGLAHLKRALAVADESRNLLQTGRVNLALAELLQGRSPQEASQALDAAEKAFREAKAPGLLAAAARVREEGVQRGDLRAG
ncbi:serine/threonine-protein kinase [Stigmatella aurantiaca]|uniref:Serine/threonine protein kinase n=1 Tax=Stigmatella aurantiaca (strain DW4/3-1) TaxID=378806 RepID=E3FLP6_STIAD|nr:serine/threonine-protein kinase [Stigmatella aurantiaca]ADO74310.1 serine/threonine protein kinase [Stigmatella aurantiaca DW4/3-1]